MALLSDKPGEEEAWKEGKREVGRGEKKREGEEEGKPRKGD